MFFQCRTSKLQFIYAIKILYTYIHICSATQQSYLILKRPKINFQKAKVRILQHQVYIKVVDSIHIRSHYINFFFLIEKKLCIIKLAYFVSYSRIYHFLRLSFCLNNDSRQKVLSSRYVQDILEYIQVYRRLEQSCRQTQDLVIIHIQRYKVVNVTY